MTMRPSLSARPGLRARVAVTASELWQEYRGPAALGVVVAAGAVATAAVVSVSPPGGFLPEPEQVRPAQRTDASAAGRDVSPLVPAGLSPRLATAGLVPDGGSASPAGSVPADPVVASLTSGAPVTAAASLRTPDRGTPGGTGQVVATPVALSSPAGSRSDAPPGTQTSPGPATGSGAADRPAQPAPTRTSDSPEPTATARPAPSRTPSPSASPPAAERADQPQPSTSPTDDHRMDGHRSGSGSSDPGDD